MKKAARHKLNVAKFHLDVFAPDTGVLLKLDNTESAVDEFCQFLDKKVPVMVAMEATGGYERLLLNQLAKHKIEATVLNPRRVWDL